MTRRFTWIGLAILVLALVATIYWEARALIRWEDLKADREAKRQNLNSEIQAASRRAAASRLAASALAAKIAERTAAAAAHGRDSTAATTAANASPALFKMQEHLRQLQIDGVSASVSLQWGLLLKKLNLTTEQAAKFLAIQTDTETQKVNILASAAEAGESDSNPDVANQIKQIYKDNDQEVRALLAPADYSVYKAYSQFNSTLGLANDLAGNLPASDALTDNQVEQLTQILGHASTVDQYGYVVYGTVNWDEAMPQAQAVLTPNQYYGLQSLESGKTAQWQLTKLLAGYGK